MHRQLYRLKLSLTLWILLAGSLKASTLHFQLLGYPKVSLQGFFKAIDERTSIGRPDSKILYQASLQTSRLKQPWFISKNDKLLMSGSRFKNNFWEWLVRGGFAVAVSNMDEDELAKSVAAFRSPLTRIEWKVLDSTSEASKSFYLIKSLPACKKSYWQGLYINQRLALILVPYDIVGHISRGGAAAPCREITKEDSVRAMINAIVVAFTTDYKNDQIHLPAILKRIRQ